MKQLIFILLAIIGVSQAQTIQYIGAPTTTVISRGNFRTDSIFYLPKRTKLPTDTAALRYQISDSSLYAWTGSQWRKVGADADTLVYSTRAWRQKGDDSLAARINLKVNISDTASMLTPYLRKVDTTAMLSPYYRSATASAALALKLNISDTSSMLGNYIRHAGYGLTKSGQSFLVDTLNIATRAWRQKGLDSLAALEVSGSGTTNYVAKFTGASTIGNSIIFDNATNVGIGTSSPSARLHIVGAELRVQNDNALYSFRNAAGTRTGYLQARADAFDIWNDQAVPMVFGTNNTERLRITSDGDILHRGTYNPLSAANRGNIMLNGSASNIIGFSNNSALRGYIFHTDSDFQFYNNTTGGRVGLYTEATARLWIQANGRIGINTTTDAGYQLDINGTLRSVNGANFATTSGNVGVGTTSPTTYAGYTTLAVNNATNGGVIDVMRNNSVILQIFGDAGASGIGSLANVPFTFKTNSIEQGRINTAGEFLLNSTNTDAGDYKLQVSGNALFTNAFLSANTGAFVFGTNSAVNPYIQGTSGNALAFGTSNNPRMQITADGEILINTSSDAGDYKLQVSGNARIGTGKLDIASNTTFGLGIARSGTSEVAGQIYNSNGILYLGAESSAGGQIFSGSSAYAAVIGSGANYPLQFATNNATRATINTAGELLIATTTDNGDFKLQVNGNGYITGNLQINPSANTTGIYMPSMSWTGSNASAAVNVSGTLNTTGAPSLIYVDVSDVASGTETNFMQFVNSDTKFRVTKQGDIQTAAPSGGTARKWKLGSVVATSVQLDTNNYVEVEINGTFYRLAIVTPL